MEAMISLLLGALVIGIALGLYTSASAIYKAGSSSGQSHQTVRSAFDFLKAELRNAGFNHNPDGEIARPDEPIEGAWDTAVTLRYDADHDDATLGAVPESSLTGTFNVVSTGNDEIVTYVLVRPDGTGDDSIRLDLDVAGSTRDGVVETVVIDDVELVQDEPPYDLYRLTFSNDGTLFGSDEFVVRERLVSDVYSMTFRYRDATGGLLNVGFDPQSFDDDIGGADAVDVTLDGYPTAGTSTTLSAEEWRSRIRHVELDIVGLRPDSEPDYVDPDDPYAATRSRRKFGVSTSVQGHNLGLRGMADVDLLPPTAPAAPSVCTGHCQGIYAYWSANPPADLVSRYILAVGTESGNYTEFYSTAETWVYVSGLTSPPYYVALQAQDFSGNLSAYSTEVTATPYDSPGSPPGTTPGAVPADSLTASGGHDVEAVDNEVQLQWEPVTDNVETIGCDALAPLLRDFAAYNVYRSTEAGFAPSPSTLHATVEGAQPGMPGLVDGETINCRTYHYNVTAVDLCGHEGAPLAASAAGRSTTATAPAGPPLVQASITGSFQVTVSWDAAEVDELGRPITVDTYRVYRAFAEAGQEDPEAIFTPWWTVTALEMVDHLAWNPNPDSYSYYYKVTAMDDCGNETPVDAVVAAEAACGFDGELRILPPGDVYVGYPATLQVEASGGEVLSTVELAIYDTTGTAVFEATDTTAPFSFDWTPAAAGAHTVVATGTTADGCSRSAQLEVEVDETPGCCLQQTTTPYLTRRDKDFNVTLANVCEEDLTFTLLSVQFDDGSGRKLTSLQLDDGTLANVGSGNNAPGDAIAVTASAPTNVFEASHGVGAPEELAFGFNKSCQVDTVTEVTIEYVRESVGAQSCVLSIYH